MTAANLASELESLISRYSIPEIVSALADAMETDVADLMQIEWSDEEIAHAAELAKRPPSVARQCSREACLTAARPRAPHTGSLRTCDVCRTIYP
jgi:hypothetical protein